MARLIDTSVVVELDRRRLPLGTLAVAASGESFALSSLTASELLVGVRRTAPGERQRRRAAFVEAELAEMRVVPFDLLAARVHARLLSELLDAGRPIGATDLLIASTALVHGYDVLTFNVREFARVPGLVVHRPVWGSGSRSLWSGDGARRSGERHSADRRGRVWVRKRWTHRAMLPPRPPAKESGSIQGPGTVTAIPSAAATRSRMASAGTRRRARGGPPPRPSGAGRWAANARVRG